MASASGALSLRQFLIALAVAPVSLGAAGATDKPAPMQVAAGPEVLTLDEAARFLRLRPQAVAGLARSDSLPGRYVDGRWRFHRSALVDWLKGDRFAPAVVAEPAGGMPATVPVLSSTAGEPALPAATTPARTAPDQPQPATTRVPPTVGERPNERRAEETALRDQGVLLPAGRTTVEVGLTYARAERQNFGLLRVEQNTFASNLALRYGLRDDLQVSARLPGTYRRLSTNVVASLGDSARSSESYVGDLSASVLGVASRERSGRPNVILSADAVMPTGPGDRGLGAGIVLSKSFDPVVLFAGASYMHGFHVDDSDRRRVLAADNLGFNFGYAYAVNDSVALSGAFIGSYRTTPRGPGTGGLAPSRESYQLQFGATLQIGRGLFLEPTVGIGVGGAAPDVTLSLSVPYTF